MWQVWRAWNDNNPDGRWRTPADAEPHVARSHVTT